MKKNKFSKEKFLFNPATLQFENVGRNITRTVKRSVSFLLFSFIVAAIYYFFYSMFFDTLSEHSTKRENEILAEYLEELNHKYQKLDEVINDIAKRDTSIYHVIFESKPIDVFANRNSSSERLESIKEKTNRELTLIAGAKLDTLTKKITKYSILFDSLKTLVSKTQDEIEFIPSIFPVTDLNLNSIGASVGNKMHPIYKSLHIHTGIDFAVSAGSDVIATTSGTVKSVVTKKFSTGTEIIIDHGNEYETRYLYLSSSEVKKNDRIKCGTIIGKVGNIGVTIPHLHYEVRIGGKVADPLNYFFRELSPKESILLAAISSDKGQSLD